MALEFALEDFPKEATLTSGESIVLRPLRRIDEVALRDFYLQVPEHERMFIKERLTDPAVVKGWCENLDYEVNLPLLAWLDDRVIAEATLHQRQGGWKKHIGVVTELTHPDFRGKGASEILIEELIELARHAGLRRLEAELNGERAIAITSFCKAGFDELVRLPGYVQDMQANYHDWVLMGLELVREEYASAG